MPAPRFRPILVLFSIALFLALATPCNAWTAAGHELIGLLTYRQLPAEQRAKAAELLTHLPSFDHDLGPATAGLAEHERNERILMLASTWPDLIRTTTHPAHAEHRAGWHVVRMPIVNPEEARTNPHLAAAALRPSTGELLEVLPQLQHDLATSTTMTKRERAVALAWILHLTQDIHQPLHAISFHSKQWPAGDSVGSGFFVTRKPKGRPMSLHTVWDLQFGGREPIETVRSHAASIEQDASLSTAGLAAEIAETSAVVWALESRELSREVAYRLTTSNPLQGEPGSVIKGVYTPPSDAPLLPADYEPTAHKVSRRRAALAAGRLANFLAGVPFDREASAARGLLEGFNPTPQFGEQFTSFTVQPGIQVHMNAPGPEQLDPLRPTRLVLYGLPNGNTTAQTIGRAPGAGIDWHFFIQHVGAQIRRLRELMPQHNIVVAYLESEKRSWPSWRQKYPDHPKLLRDLVETLRTRVAPLQPTVEFAAHSGGGGLLFGLLDSGETLPQSLTRIALLDANYAYDDTKGHGEKLADWLRSDPDHVLAVLCYDDRYITLNGKPVLKSPAGGTYGSTMRMLDRFRSLKLLDDITSTTEGNITTVRALKGRLDVRIHNNPENKILHTVQVEKNGVIHTLMTGTADEAKADRYFGDPAYTKWVQAEETK